MPQTFTACEGELYMPGIQVLPDLCPAGLRWSGQCMLMTLAAAGAYSHGWKLKRVSLMKLVCIETARMEAVRVQQLPYVFQRLPLNTHGNLPLSEVCLSLTHSMAYITKLPLHLLCWIFEGRLQAPTTRNPVFLPIWAWCCNAQLSEMHLYSLSQCTCT